MKKLRECISEQIPIDRNGLDVILSKFEARQLNKGSYFLKAGKICREMAFVESGYLRMFDLADGKEVTLWIGSEGRFITSLSSFVFESENYWNIQALTDCHLQVISKKDHVWLCQEQRKWLEFDNALLANSFALLEQRMFFQLHTTSQQRFDALIQDNPAIFNHVPLQYIASMLGITAETLSRLRKNNTRITS